MRKARRACINRVSGKLRADSRTLGRAGLAEGPVGRSQAPAFCPHAHAWRFSMGTERRPETALGLAQDSARRVGGNIAAGPWDGGAVFHHDFIFAVKPRL